MRRALLFLLVGVLLTVSVSSYAEYKGYQLTDADSYFRDVEAELRQC